MSPHDPSQHIQPVTILRSVPVLKVSVVNLSEIPFTSAMLTMVKWALAAIPAAFILMVIFWFALFVILFIASSRGMNPGDVMHYFNPGAR